MRVKKAYHVLHCHQPHCLHVYKSLMEWIYSIGKPTGASTFGDLADIVIQSMRSNFSNNCTRVDVVFDRYIEHSIRHGSREYRVRGQTELAKHYGLARKYEEHNPFCQISLIQYTLEVGSDMRISGGFLEADRIVSCAGHDIISLCATHELTHAIMQCHMVTTELYSMLYINSMVVQV